MLMKIFEHWITLSLKTMLQLFIFMYTLGGSEMALGKRFHHREKL